MDDSLKTKRMLTHNYKKLCSSIDPLFCYNCCEMYYIFKYECIGCGNVKYVCKNCNYTKNLSDKKFSCNEILLKSIL